MVTAWDLQTMSQLSLSATELPASQLNVKDHLLPVPEHLKLDLVSGPLLIQDLEQIPLQLDLLSVNSCKDISQHHSPKFISAATKTCFQSPICFYTSHRYTKSTKSFQSLSLCTRKCCGVMSKHKFAHAYSCSRKLVCHMQPNLI